MTSIQKTVVVLAALVAIVLGLTVHKVLGSKGDGLDKAALLDAGIILLPQSRELPELTLTNVDGQPQALSSLKGKWTLVFFGYTFCPDICPTTLAQLRQLNSQLPAETRSQLQILMVSLDPHRDTPEKLKQYLGFFDPAYLGLTGPLADIQKLANAVSIPFIPGDTSKENYTVDHSGNLVLLGPDGRQRGFIRAPLKNEKLKVQLPQVIKPEA
ncbi:cytochrome c oxidase assembly protein [Pseudomonas sp. HAR-UPW-AIA-41]|uniref:SCO family protein n=1 Tax=Pseudomonas sp. HAR-UPW-AIA-41 TaxID=1985301 RepID=UPI000BB38364|nr:SCO family protein [Pseudomonas sp. HAR-UPW-AIA-41]PAV47340.1 cytochrome c oxidase assembly protein [Pseudomonas sp. HAR-UPW-AIA-41]